MLAWGRVACRDPLSASFAIQDHLSAGDGHGVHACLPLILFQPWSHELKGRQGMCADTSNQLQRSRPLAVTLQHCFCTSWGKRS